MKVGPLDDNDSASGDERPLVLIIDDDEFVRRLLERQLLRLSCDVLLAADGESGLRMAVENEPAVIFLDLRMPELDGHTFLRRLPASGIQASIVVMSGDGDVDDVIGAMRTGAVDFLRKPWQADDLVSTLERALDIFKAFGSASE